MLLFRLEAAGRLACFNSTSTSGGESSRRGANELVEGEPIVVSFAFKPHGARGCG